MNGSVDQTGGTGPSRTYGQQEAVAWKKIAIAVVVLVGLVWVFGPRELAKVLSWPSDDTAEENPRPICPVVPPIPDTEKPIATPVPPTSRDYTAAPHRAGSDHDLLTAKILWETDLEEHTTIGTTVDIVQKLLTQISLFWFSKLGHIIPNHFVTADIDEIPEEVRKYKDQLDGRAMLVKKANFVPLEAIVRGYLTGSAWSEYKRSEQFMEFLFLLAYIQLPEPLFTPSTKAEQGAHDENISPEQGTSSTISVFPKSPLLTSY
ncbi:hypothetical protein C8J55DRAFT_553445 [Lentinula edodes]|uniref:Phosphoribosylaminoimidazole-succinocarboxamide synthase n=1 Tax=Lentinula lateritia TaxID=40482 RepID=A0A9W9E0N3_9AGAR|nr:hypothetical protein C8J55DRAFT_553445 [Lentinula edodes]